MGFVSLDQGYRKGVNVSVCAWCDTDDTRNHSCQHDTAAQQGEHNSEYQFGFIHNLWLFGVRSELSTRNLTFATEGRANNHSRTIIHESGFRNQSWKLKTGNLFTIARMPVYCCSDDSSLMSVESRGEKGRINCQFSVGYFLYTIKKGGICRGLNTRYGIASVFYLHMRYDAAPCRLERLSK